MVGEAQSDKENNLVLDAREYGSLALPQTPVHLLKRGQSNVLKPTEENHSPEKRRASVSPIKGGQRRLPLASKDHNRSNAAGVIKKRKSISQGVDFLSNPKKLKRYGSILGCVDLPRTKSLVLKDVGDDKEKDEEDEENTELQKELKDAVTGQRVRAPSVDIEYAPERVPSLEYEPDGHTLWDDADIEKLKRVDLKIHEDDLNAKDDEEPRNNDGDFLPLTIANIRDSDYDIDLDEKEHSTRSHEMHVLSPTSNVLNVHEVETAYKGEGLNAEELEDLLSC